MCVWPIYLIYELAIRELTQLRDAADFAIVRFPYFLSLEPVEGATPLEVQQRPKKNVRHMLRTAGLWLAYSPISVLLPITAFCNPSFPARRTCSEIQVGAADRCAGSLVMAVIVFTNVTILSGSEPRAFFLNGDIQSRKIRVSNSCVYVAAHRESWPS
eukprot:scaffold91273_cov41-Prasinocladus_malaysianus.AAC.2